VGGESETAVSGQHTFGGKELKVAFDNFKVTGTNPICS
jgi:hypothetical protein